MDRLRFVLVNCLGGLKQPIWVWIITSFFYLMMLTGIAIPAIEMLAVFLFIVIGPLALWIVSVSDAFKNTEVNRGWLVLLCPPYATRYLFKHSTSMFPRRIMNVLLLCSLPLFIGDLFSNDTDEDGGSVTIYSSELGWMPNAGAEETENIGDARH